MNSEKPRFTTRAIARAGVIAALYVVLTMIFQPISFSMNSPIQFRISEALTLLPILTADAVPGLFIGCLLGNWLGGGVWFDVVLGSIATLLAALCTRKFRSKPVVAAILVFDWSPFGRELLNWILSALVAIVSFATCVAVKSWLSGTRPLSEIEEEVKEQARRDFGA